MNSFYDQEAIIEVPEHFRWKLENANRNFARIL